MEVCMCNIFLLGTWLKFILQPQENIIAEEIILYWKARFVLENHQKKSEFDLNLLVYAILPYDYHAEFSFAAPVA